MAERIPILARRKLFSTTSSQEVGKIRAALTRADIPFRIDQSEITPPVGSNGVIGGRHPWGALGLQSLGAIGMSAPDPLPAYEYTFYVHKDDVELAQAALDGSLD